ncbi:MAG: hypothetical protein QM770_02075 [Tepidisphaeraceae bacterium]
MAHVDAPTLEDRARDRASVHAQCAADIGIYGHAFLQGTYPLVSKYGTVKDRYDLTIMYPHDFLPLGPRGDFKLPVSAYPSVFLESHHDQWVRRIDGHIMSEWELCLFVPGDVEIDFRLPNSLERLFEAIHAFLVLQCIYQADVLKEKETGVEAVWPGGQRSHGIEGCWEAVRDRGGMFDHEPCICGSRYRYDDCCKPFVLYFEQKKKEAA